MRRFTRSVLCFALLASPLASAKTARNCDSAYVGDSNTAYRTRESAIHDSFHAVWEDEDRPANKIYFVIPSENGKDSEVLSVTVPSGTAIEVKPDEIRRRLAEATELRIYNKTSHPQLYFVPFAKDEMKGFDPKQHCTDAVERSRAAGPGCTRLTHPAAGKNPALPGLKDMGKLTLLYAESADKCDKISTVQRKAAARKSKTMTDSELALFKESVDNLHEYFDIPKGVNRRPSNLAAPTYADGPVDTQRTGAKKLKQTPPGGRRGSPAAKKSGAKETRGVH